MLSTADQRRVQVLNVVTVGFCALLLAACESPYVSYPAVKALADTEGAPARFLADTTVHTFDPYHLNQYEYLAPDGTTALLYPGNIAPVRGYWQVRGKGEFDAKMCFLYGPNTYNPVTHERGGRWECDDLTDYLYRAEEIYDGDVFGTRSITYFPAPFPRWGAFHPISAAVAATGKTPPKGPTKAFSKEMK